MIEHVEQSSSSQDLPLSWKFGLAASSGTAVLAADAIGNLGLPGLVLGGVGCAILVRHSPSLYTELQKFIPMLPDPQSKSRASRGEWTLLDRLQGKHLQDRVVEQVENEETIPTDTLISPSSEARDVELTDEEGEEDMFTLGAVQKPLPCRRVTMEEIVNHLEYNGYVVCLGRSVQVPNNPAVCVNILKQHLKLIGASQKGKSSMAATILETLIRTHDVQHLLIAVLDMEDQTGKLFGDDPHVATFHHMETGARIRMHARSREQVLEHLRLIVDMMEYRYTLTKKAVAEQPLLVVYIEEFLALKDYFKKRIARQKDQESKAQAQADYASLVYCVDELARRGLKARIQLLLCAQVDYRDEDLCEAMANITAGMCFCVKPTAAAAAGFSDVDLLKRNYMENLPGQAVAEFSGCKDLVLAPEYNLEQRLIAWEKEYEHLQEQATRTVQQHPVSRMEDMPVREAPRPEMKNSPPVDTGDREKLDRPGPSDNTVQKPVEPPDASGLAYRLSDFEVKRFIGAYVRSGSMEKALHDIGHGARYKPHARRIIAEYELGKHSRNTKGGE